MGRMAQHSGRIGQRSQGLQDQGRIMVVNAALVAFTVARRGEFAYRLGQRLGIGQ